MIKPRQSGLFSQRIFIVLHYMSNMKSQSVVRHSPITTCPLKIKQSLDYDKCESTPDLLLYIMTYLNA